MRPILFCSSILISLTACKGDSLPENTGKSFQHKDNVFEYSPWYVNQHWVDKARASGGEAIAGQSTAVWLHSIQHVDPNAEPLDFEADNIFINAAANPPVEMGLAEHFQAAQAQGNALLQLVLKNAPYEHCMRRRRNEAELPATSEGFYTYQTQYIDRIVDIASTYPEVPFAAIIEPRSWAAFFQYRDYARCPSVSNQYVHSHTNAIRYAINRLSTLPQAHIYLDIGGANHFGWNDTLIMAPLYLDGIVTGFDDLTDRAKELGIEIESKDGGTGYYQEIEVEFVEPPEPEYGDTSPPGYSKIDGFASNIAGYVPLDEPYIDSSDPTLRQEGAFASNFYDWNPRIDEWTYTREWMVALKKVAGDLETAHLGVVIDTSRNGWGQSQKRLEGSTVIDTREEADSHRLDQRGHRSNWCNQVGAGLGKRPQLASGDQNWIDAYIWAKPPGESDGHSDPDLAFWEMDLLLNGRPMTDPSCDPEELSWFAERAESTFDQDIGTGAMEGALHVTEWFDQAFAELLENAWPPVCDGQGDDCD